jgi:hypothetical protein
METTNRYVLLTSADGHTKVPESPAFGPYLTRELAKDHARETQVPHHHVLEWPATHGPRG